MTGSKGGLLPRFLTCRTQSHPQCLSREIKEFPALVAAAYESRIMELLETYRMHTGDLLTVTMADDAQTAFCDYSDRITERIQADEFTPVERRFAKRWAENAWRVGLVLHGAEHGKRAYLEPVTVATAKAAIALVSWYALQQLAVLGVKQKADEGTKEEKVMKMVRTHGRINIRSLKKAGICATDEEAGELLEGLRQECKLEAHDRTGRGPATRYYVLPRNPTT